jgi:hypothetical protein
MYRLNRSRRRNIYLINVVLLKIEIEVYADNKDVDVSKLDINFILMKNKDKRKNDCI